MRLHKIEGPWPASGKVMVCVSASPFSAQLIRAAQRLAQGLHAEFLAVHIETPERRFPHGDKERERLWRNLNLAKELGGQILTTAGTDLWKRFCRSLSEKCYRDRWSGNQGRAAGMR